MKRIIEVSDNVRSNIMKAFGVTGKTVHNALSYDPQRGYTDLASRIRVMALNNGGRHVVSLPECETIHNENDGTMVQTFGNGAKLILYKKTGDIEVEFKGTVRLRRKDARVSQIYEIQDYAERLI